MVVYTFLWCIVHYTSILVLCASLYIVPTLPIVHHILNKWLDFEWQIPHGQHSRRGYSLQSIVATYWRDVLEETRCATILDSAQIFICSFIYSFFNKGLKEIDGQSLHPGRKRRICRDNCFTRTNWIFLFLLTAHDACVCVPAKIKQGDYFFCHLCSNVWTIIAHQWLRQRGASNWTCWRKTERVDMQAGRAAICLRVRKKGAKEKLPDGWE